MVRQRLVTCLAQCVAWKGFTAVANEQNLIPQAHVLTVEEQSAGGRASGKARREKRLLRDALQELLDREYTDKQGNTADGTTVLATQLFKKAQKGDLRAWQILRDTVGQMPVQRVEVDTIDPATRAEMDELVRKASQQ